MRMTLLLLPFLAASAHAADPAATPQPLVQGLAPTPAAPGNAKTAAASKAMAGPKIHEMIATRNDDGTLNVGCVERPNPRAGKPLPNTLSPETQQ